MKRKKRMACFAVLTMLTVLLTGCAFTVPQPNRTIPTASATPTQSAVDVSKEALLYTKAVLDEKKNFAALPFLDDQLYAAAYLGYQEIEDLSWYVQNYLSSENIPIHYFSSGEYYLIIPRYPDLSLKLYQRDMQSDNLSLVFESPVCVPFIIQCNASDIFADTVIFLSNDTNSVSFSPHISLVDGAVEIGDQGLNITKPNN